MKELLLNLWRGVCMYPVGLFWKLAYRVQPIGVANVPRRGGVLICANHISGFETMLIPWYVIDAFGRFSRRRFWSPAKEDLFMPPLGWIIGSWRAFPVKRNQRDYSSMNRIAELAKDDVVMIYPEGTRSKTGALGKGKPGVGKIIYDSRTAVVPCAVINTRYCLPKGKWLPRFRVPLYVVYGAPLDLSHLFALPPSKETSQAIVDEVMKGIRRLLEEHAEKDLLYAEGQSQAQVTRAQEQQTANPI